MKSSSEHWNRIFRETADEQLGWYESDPANTLRLLNRIPGWETSSYFLPGVGTSVLIDVLLDAGASLILNDISRDALDHVRERIGDRGDAVEWNCRDVAQPLGDTVPEIDVWLDRAMLHFLTDEEDISAYFNNVRAKVKMGGQALFAEFPPQGVSHCAGLELHRYSVRELSERLGSGFKLIDHFNHRYISPAGEERLYLYTLFRRCP